MLWTSTNALLISKKRNSVAFDGKSTTTVDEVFNSPDIWCVPSIVT
jgi:hypothetical protein